MVESLGIINGRLDETLKEALGINRPLHIYVHVGLWSKFAPKLKGYFVRIEVDKEKKYLASYTGEMPGEFLRIQDTRLKEMFACNIETCLENGPS